MEPQNESLSVNNDASIALDVSSTSAKVSVLLLRLALGWLFFYAGWSKVITFFTDARDWSAGFFLNSLEGPFAEFFASMAGNQLIDYLNAYGLLLVGIALILGVLVRWSAFWGIVLMVMYYLAGYPPDHAFIMDDHLIYVFALVVLMAIGAGRYWGLDQKVEKMSFAANNKLLKALLG